MDNLPRVETGLGGLVSNTVAELQALLKRNETWLLAQPEIEEFGVGLDPAGRPCLRIGVVGDRQGVERRIAEKFPKVCTFVKPAPSAQAYGG